MGLSAVWAGCFGYSFKAVFCALNSLAQLEAKRLSQTITITTPKSAANKLALNIPTVMQVLPSLELGDFAVLSGSRAVSYLTSVLCINAQLPRQLGGLSSKVVFVDGANSFRLYQIAKLSQQRGLNPKQVLKQIHIARAFTAYQMTALIMEKLAKAAGATGAKLAILSDSAGLFLDEEIADEEAQAIYQQVVTFLAALAKKKQLIMVATYLPHNQTKRNTALQAATYEKANVTASIMSSEHHRYFVLQKHPRYGLGSAEFPPACPTLPEFFGGTN